MKLIKRIDLKIEPKQKISFPFGSEILGEVDLIKGTPCLWVLIGDHDPNARSIEVSIQMVDKEVEQRLNCTKCLGRFTVEAEVGQKTLHVFEDT